MQKAWMIETSGLINSRLLYTAAITGGTGLYDNARGTLTVTASFGITQAMPGEINIQPLLARADAALHRAKDEGRNCVRIAADTLSLLRQHKPSAAG